MICPKCGHENAESATNCANCRVNLQWALEQPEELAAHEEENARRTELTKRRTSTATLINVLLYFAGAVVGGMVYAIGGCVTAFRVMSSLIDARRLHPFGGTAYVLVWIIITPIVALIGGVIGVCITAAVRIVHRRLEGKSIRLRNVGVVATLVLLIVVALVLLIGGVTLFWLSQACPPKCASAHLRGADLGEADLNEADLRGADLSEADLHRADLSGTDLSVADLSRADLSGADLSGADLSKADLRGADLTEATLYEADLSGTDLTGANLRHADLREVDLTYAYLIRADLRRADLSGANVTDEQLARAKSLEGATMPDGTKHE